MTPRASATTVRAATAPEIEAILGWTHAIWGVKSPFPAYVARTRALMGSPWGRERYRFMIAHDAAGTPVAGCKLYRLAVALGARPAEAVGFGAVFTRPEHRGQGHAGRMLRQLMDAAALEGAACALLFSDIGPALYADLGFQALEVEVGRASALPGPAPFAPWPAARPIPAAWRPASAFRVERTPEYWAYALARVEAAPLAWLPDGPDAPPRGFVVADLEDDGLWVEDGGHAPDADPGAFWSDVRRLAAARGAAEAAGWLPAGAEPGGFARTPLTAPLPMAASLAGDRPPAACQLWSIDHF